MQKLNFNTEWMLSRKGEKASAKAVTLPYDAMLYEKRSRAAGGATGYFPGGTYTYTHRFTAPEDWRSKSIILEFEAVYKNASVSLNGKTLAFWPYGYTNFFVSLDEALIYGGENELTVVADNSACPNSRWYSGSGIYRSVNLYLGSKAHIEPDGLLIRAEQSGRMQVKVHVTGGSAVRVTVFDGEQVLCTETAAVLNEAAEMTLNVAEPKLWDSEHPNLYRCTAELLDGDTITDQEESDFGFRTLSWSTRGFFVNGQETLLRGACVHHDNGILGACSYPAAEERRVRLLKEAGFNAIRSAHNPAAKGMLDACDKLGMYVMDELCDQWLIHKTPCDYADEDFRKWWKKDLLSMLKKNYSHPCVVMTSIGNEISELGLLEGQDFCRQLADFTRAFDPTRPVTMGTNLSLCSMAVKNAAKKKRKENDGGGGQTLDNAPTSQLFNLLMNRLGGIMDRMTAKPEVDKATWKAFDILDISGYNYATSRYEMDGKLHPDRVIIGSETLPGSLYRNWQFVKRLPYLTGDFMWTGWDHLGEAALGTVRYKSYQKTADTAPTISSGCGVIDICGKLRPEVQWNKLIWGLTEKPDIGVEPLTHAHEVGSVSMWRNTDGVESWSWAGCEGKKTKVIVYASGAYAELLVNGKSYGKKKTKEYKAEFKKVAYKPGTITAISYDVSGKEIGRSSLATAVGKTVLRLTAEKETLCADGQDLCYLNIELTGEDGTLKVSEDCPVHVEVTGAGELLALGSARPNMGENFHSPTHTTYYGKALAVIRAGNTAGKTIVKVSAPNLEEKTIIIH